jgi:hypothetical protein
MRDAILTVPLRVSGILCGEGFEHRKQWIEERLQTLSGCFAVSVCGFAVMALIVTLRGAVSASISECSRLARGWLRWLLTRSLSTPSSPFSGGG